MNETSMFFNSFFKTLELVKLIYSGHKAIEVDKEIAPLLSMILSMENNVVSMKSYISKLEEENKTKSEEIIKLQKWTEIEKQYKLHDIAPGMPLQKSISIDSKETIQWACPKCWHNHIEQPLHRKHHSEEIGSYVCPVCGTLIEWNNCDYSTKKSRLTIG
jgi:hypothetical protein